MPFVMGCEVAGIVDAIGEDVDDKFVVRPNACG